MKASRFSHVADEKQTREKFVFRPSDFVRLRFSAVLKFLRLSCGWNYRKTLSAEQSYYQFLCEGQPTLLVVRESRAFVYRFTRDICKTEFNYLCFSVMKNNS